MSKITKVKLPKRGQLHNYFIAGDWHSFSINPHCYSILIQHAKKFPKKDRKLIINGDFLDLWWCMKKDEKFKKYGKDLAKYVPMLMKKKEQLFEQIMSQKEEMKVFEESKTQMEEALECKVEIVDAEKSKEAKARVADIQKPGVFVE